MGMHVTREGGTLYILEGAQDAKANINTLQQAMPFMKGIIPETRSTEGAPTSIPIGLNDGALPARHHGTIGYEVPA